jgi:uncharacterized protein YecE (DUF72 family)
MPPPTQTHPPRARIGTSGWSYPHWKGTFYPPDLPDPEMLAYYGQQFSTVEINNSFYHLPEPHTLRQWRDAVPADFMFSAKASRYITHMKKLKDPGDSVDAFLTRIAELGDKLGPILFQLPPHWHCNNERLAAFLASLSKAFRYTFEFRDPSWINAQTCELLARHNAAFCIYHLDGYLAPQQVTADFVYLRLHGPDGPYQGSYDDGSLAEWAKTCVAWRQQGLDVYGYFDNDQAGYAAANAARLQTLLQRDHTEG